MNRARVLLPLFLLATSGLRAQPVVYDPSLEIETVITGLSSPTTMAFLGPDEFLVLEKDTGNVRRVLNGAFVAPDPVLTLPVEDDPERGALGIAIDVFVDPMLVYIYYTRDSDNNGTPEANRITRFDWSPGTGTLINEDVLLDLPALAGPNHNGGVLAIDDLTGELYAMIGDLNHTGQLQNFASGLPDNTSVILRLDPDGSAAAGNPLSPYCSNSTATTCATDAECGAGFCQTQVEAYYAYGIRNGFGLTLDQATGDVWNTENGPGNYDEVNRVPPGFNSGWRDFMGPQVSQGQDGVLFGISGGSYSNPEFSWFDTNAPTGIVLPCGCALGPIYDASALVGDSNRGQIYRFPLNGNRDGFDFSAVPALQDLVAADNTEADLVRLASGFAGVTDLEMGFDGNLYVVSIGNGTVYRFVRPSRDFFTVTPCRVVDTRSGAPLSSGVDRTINVGGSCGVPAEADAVSLNVTVTLGTGAGNVTVFPGNIPLSSAVGTINFSAGQTRANNLIAALATDGDGTIIARASVAGGGTVHFIVDVNGYFLTSLSPLGAGRATEKGTLRAGASASTPCALRAERRSAAVNPRR